MSCSEKGIRRVPRRHLAVFVVAVIPGITAVAAEPVRLTTDGTLKMAPVFTSNGEEVAFATHEAPNLVAIVALRLSNGSRRRLHPTSVNHQFDPAFSRDGAITPSADHRLRLKWYS